MLIVRGRLGLDRHSLQAVVATAPQGRMVTRPVQATGLAVYLVLIAIMSPSSSAQFDYLAPAPAPADVACDDTAPDCAAICNTNRDSAGACQSRTPIGDYLRCTLALPYCVGLLHIQLEACRFSSYYEYDVQSLLQEHLWPV